MVAKIGLNFNWDKSRKSDNLNMKAIFVVMYTTWAVEKIRPEKKFRAVRDIPWSDELLHGFFRNQHSDQLPVRALHQYNKGH